MPHPSTPLPCNKQKKGLYIFRKYIGLTEINEGGFAILFASPPQASPGNHPPVIADEFARVRRDEAVDDLAHVDHALFDRNHRVGAAHVGLDPAGVEGHGGDALFLKVDGQAFDHHVCRRFAAAIQVAPAAAVVGHAAHLAGDGDDELEFAARDLLDERFGHLERSHGVDAECGHPFRIVGMTKAASVRSRIDACVVDEQVYRLTGQRPRKLLDLRMVGDVQGMEFDQLGIAGRQFVERIRLAGIAATSQDTPAISRILLAELQPDAAVGAGYQ